MTGKKALGIDATPLLGQRSGVGNYTGNLLAAMVRQAPDWEFILFSNRPLGQLEPSLAGTRQVNGYWSGSRWLWTQLMLPRIIARNQPDVSHFTNSLAPVWLKTPYVLSIHDASLFLYSGFHPKTRLLTIRLLLPQIARRAAAIVTMSRSARDDLVRVLRLPAEKFHVIHEAAPDQFRPVTDQATLAAVRLRYGLPERFILYVGTLEPRKNLERLVRAFQQVRRRGFDHHLIFVGPRGWLMDGFCQRIRRLGLDDSVHLLGFVPNDELPALYSLATLFAFPSLYEGFGLPPLEAMACGVPVVTSDRSSLAELYGDAAHLVDPYDEMALADAISHLLADDEWRAELRHLGLRRAGRFSWDTTAKRTMEVYRQVLNGA